MGTLRYSLVSNRTKLPELTGFTLMKLTFTMWIIYQFLKVVCFLLIADHVYPRPGGGGGGVLDPGNSVTLWKDAHERGRKEVKGKTLHYFSNDFKTSF